MLRKLKWQIPGEPLAARCNWCQAPVPGRGPAVQKHCTDYEVGGARRPKCVRQFLYFKMQVLYS